MLRVAAWLAVCLMLGISATAAATAATTVAPPGNSGVDQYFETVPGVGGNQGIHRPGSARGPGSGTAAGPLGRLARLGADGRAAAALAAATAPAQAGRIAPAGGSPPVRVAGSGPIGSSSAPSLAAPYAPAPPRTVGARSALVGALDGSDRGGLGVGLPAALLATLAAAAGFLLLRRRSRDSG